MKPIAQKYCHGWILTQNTTSTEDFCWNSGNEKKTMYKDQKPQQSTP